MMHTMLKGDAESFVCTITKTRTNTVLCIYRLSVITLLSKARLMNEVST